MNAIDSPKSPLANPWMQLIIGVICMACVANLQYGWTLFVNPIDAKYHWGRAAIQVAFSLFVLLETWLIPVEGYMVDRFGPRWVVLDGGILVGAAWAAELGRRILWRFCILPQHSAASAPAAFTVPASATRSNGFPAGAGSPPASRRRDSAPAQRSPWYRSKR